MNLKEFATIIIILLIVITAGYTAGKLSQNGSFGGGGNSSTNKMGALISYSTTTSVGGAGYCAGCPVKILDKDVDRRYVHIHNNSDTDIYLFATTTELDLTGTGAARAATTSIATLNGIRIAANDGDNTDDDYIISPDNLIYGHLWASTTADGVAKEILVNYY